MEPILSTGTSCLLTKINKEREDRIKIIRKTSVSIYYHNTMFNTSLFFTEISKRPKQNMEHQLVNRYEQICRDMLITYIRNLQAKFTAIELQQKTTFSRNFVLFFGLVFVQLIWKWLKMR